MRLFFAIELPDPIRGRLAEVQEVLRAKIPEHVSWIRPEHCHITVRFIGECTEAQAGTLIESLKSRLFPPPLALTLADIVPMPARRGGRPIAVSVWEGTGDLNWVRTTCDDVARSAGAGQETERFVPHIALGHVRPPQRVTARELVDYLDGRWTEMEFKATSITLVRSQLSPNGSNYSAVGRLKLPAVGRPMPGEWVSSNFAH